jgi:GTP cyclohydrolase III
MGAEQPAAAAEACNQLQSAGSVQEAERQWEGHCTAGLLSSFREGEVEDRCCIADIAVEEVVRTYFQISVISLTISVVCSLSD